MTGEHFGVVLVVADMHIEEGGQDDGVPRVGNDDGDLWKLGLGALTPDTLLLATGPNPGQQPVRGLAGLLVGAQGRD